MIDPCLHEMLRFIPADDRDTWLKVGMSLHSTYGDEALPLWNEWSAQSSKYSESSNLAAWRSFKKGGIGLGTLVHIARIHGYEGRTPTTRPPDFNTSSRQIATAQASRPFPLARELWAKAFPTDRHPYLLRKQLPVPRRVRTIAAEQIAAATRQIIRDRQGNRATGDILLVPITHLDSDDIYGLEMITHDGNKVSLKGQRLPHAAAWRSSPSMERHASDFVVAEGLATALAMSCALLEIGRKSPAFATSGMSRLPRVVHHLIEKHPRATVIVGVDLDKKTRYPALPSGHDLRHSRIVLAYPPSDIQGKDWADLWIEDRQRCLRQLDAFLSRSRGLA